MDAHPVGDVDRLLGVVDPDVDVQPEDELLARDEAQRADEVAVARARDDALVLPHRERVRARRADRQPLGLRARRAPARRSAAQLGARPRPCSAHGSVAISSTDSMSSGLISPVGRPRRSDSIALTRSNVSAVADHELLLDADRVARAGEVVLHGWAAGYPLPPTRLGSRPAPRPDRDPRRPPMASTETSTRIEELLGDEADALLQHVSRTIDASQLHLPGPDFVERVVASTDRSNRGPAQPPVAVRQRPPGRHRLRLASSRSTRASSTPAAASFAPNPHLLRPREPRRARGRGRLQRLRVDVRRPRVGQPQAGRTGSRSSSSSTTTSC